MNHPYIRIRNILYWTTLAFLTIMIVSLESFAQNSTAPITKVRPYLNWDANLTLPTGAFLAPGIQPKVCKDYNSKPKNSCAAKMVSLTPTGTSTMDSIVDQIVGKFDITSTAEATQATNKLKPMLSAYNQTVCDSGGVKACVLQGRALLKIGQKEDETCFKLFSIPEDELKDVCKDKYKYRECFIALVKTKVKKGTLDLQNAINQCESSRNAKNVKFAVYNSSAKIFNKSHFYYPPFSYTVSQLAEGIENYPKDGFKRANHLFQKKYLQDVATSTNIPPITQVTGDQLLFVVNTPTLENLTGETDFKTKIRKFLRASTTDVSSTALTAPIKYKITKITIAASSSTPSNNANYCQKDFVALSTSRALKVKSLINEALLEDGITLDEKTFDVRVMGTNNDGTSGDCAYRCAGYNGVSASGVSPAPSSGECVEVQVNNYSQKPFTSYQKVIATITLSPLKTVTTTVAGPTIYDFYLKIPRYIMMNGCKFEDLKGCFNDIKKSSGDVIPGNVIH